VGGFGSGKHICCRIFLQIIAGALTPIPAVIQAFNSCV
jgi:hypothetical protein